MLIGITGGIGSGKSAVTEYLRNLGEVVICADEVSRLVVRPGEKGAVAIRNEFGSEFFDSSGKLNRKKLADYVFKDKSLTVKLNQLLHPIIIDRIFALAAKFSGRVFLDVVLLIQSGMQNDLDFVWLVVAEKNIRIQRVMQRDNTDEKRVLARIKNQMSDSEMIPFADEVIQNNGSIEELHKKVDMLLNNSKYTEVE